ncbi:MAG: 5-dehydro-4-deoxyglucarate dehydratase [Luteitalea sp.]|nr:5-dehydro-4-deoxyglucarate dehydratase [Luteitalea sp.]
MTPSALRDRLTGVIAFPVTPFLADGSLDVDGLRRNVEALAAHPFCGLVAAGGTGELYSLSEAEHRLVVETSVQAIGGRMPVIAGVGGSIALACEQARQAAAAGAAGILALPPYYPEADETGLVAYYRGIGASTALGLLVYSRDWVNPGPAFVERVANIPTLIAWKDGQGNIRRYQIIMASIGDRLHWIGGAGDDLVPAYYRLGIRTYTSSISNIAPRLSLALHETAAAGDEAALQQLMTRYVIPLYAFRARRKGYEVAVMKAMMALLGFAAGPVRPPLVEVTDTERDELAKMLDGWKDYL